MAAFIGKLIQCALWGRGMRDLRGRSLLQRLWRALFSPGAGRRWAGWLFAAHEAADPEAAGVPTDELIRRFQDGEPRAFDALYDRYKDSVYRTALFVTRNAGDAEDAVQETFINVLKALPHYRIDGPARFETWLYRVTLNRCRSRLRRKSLPRAEWNDVEERLESIPVSDPEGAPEAAFERRERARTLWQAVNVLSEAHREVIVLRYQQEFSYEEISAALGISLGTVKSRLYHAHRLLKERLQPGLP